MTGNDAGVIFRYFGRRTTRFPLDPAAPERYRPGPALETVPTRVAPRRSAASVAATTSSTLTSMCRRFFVSWIPGTRWNARRVLPGGSKNARRGVSLHWLSAEDAGPEFRQCDRIRAVDDHLINLPDHRFTAPLNSAVTAALNSAVTAALNSAVTTVLYLAVTATARSASSPT